MRDMTTEPSDESVERVARAIAEHVGLTWEGMPEVHSPYDATRYANKTTYRMIAKAALAALAPARDDQYLIGALRTIIAMRPDDAEIYGLAQGAIDLAEKGAEACAVMRGDAAAPSPGGAETDH